MSWHDLTHGWHGLLLGWLLVAVPTWVGMTRARAPIHTWLRSPVTVTILLIIGAILIEIAQWLLKTYAGLEDTSPPAEAAAMVCYVLTGYVGGRYAARSKTRESHKRGSLIEDGGSVQRGSARSKQRRAGVLTLAGVALAPEDETKHFKLIGTTGTGKSTAIRELLAGALIAAGGDSAGRESGAATRARS
jgi:hypothetical protein